MLENNQLIGFGVGASVGPITYVGGAKGGIGGAAGDYTVSLTALTGGIDTAAAAGDIVIVATGVTALADIPATNPGCITAGYTELVDTRYNALRDNNYSLNWKIMGAVPDTSVSVYGAPGTAGGASTAIQVWRNVNITPVDVPVTTSNNLYGSAADCPSITPITAGCVIIASQLGAGFGGATGLLVVPSGMTNLVTIMNTSGAIGASSWAGLASFSTWVSGAYDPAPFTGGHTDSTAGNTSAAGVTLVLRPAT